ncbi:MAG: hypothetical protein ABF904_15400 [Ethanoligenens sp.]
MAEHRNNSSEQVADLLAHLDIPHIPSAVVGCLLASEPPETTFEELQERLHISKAAVSAAMRYLEALDVVRYRTPVGSRKRLIRLEPLKLANYLKRRMVFFKNFTQSLQRIAQEHPDSAYRREITELADLFQKLDIVVQETIGEWEGERERERI